jgi:hypothetical protein
MTIKIIEPTDIVLSPKYKFIYYFYHYNRTGMFLQDAKKNFDLIKIDNLGKIIENACKIHGDGL